VNEASKIMTNEEEVKGLSAIKEMAEGCRGTYHEDRYQMKILSFSSVILLAF
jgi:hypothetical protein